MGWKVFTIFVGIYNEAVISNVLVPYLEFATYYYAPALQYCHLNQVTTIICQQGGC